MATKKTIEAAEELTQENVKPEVKVEPKEDDRVTVMLPLIDSRDSELTVGVNGVFYKIRRGVQVKVPKVVAEVIEHANIQMMVAHENEQKFKRQVTEL